MYRIHYRLFSERDVSMSQQLRDQLNKYKKKTGMESPKPKRRKKRKKQTESYSHREIEELMGVNRPTYTRGRGGAYKQK